MIPPDREYLEHESQSLSETRGHTDLRSALVEAGWRLAEDRVRLGDMGRGLTGVGAILYLKESNILLLLGVTLTERYLFKDKGWMIKAILRFFPSQMENKLLIACEAFAKILFCLNFLLMQNYS